MSLESQKPLQGKEAPVSPLEEIAGDVIVDVASDRMAYEQNLRDVDNLVIRIQGGSAERDILNTLFAQHDELARLLARTNRALGRLDMIASYKPAMEASGTGVYAKLEERAQQEKEALETIKEGALTRMEAILKTKSREEIITSAEDQDKKGNR